MTAALIWIEAALNGPWTRARQPGIPDTVAAIVAQGVACANAGACIIHTHAYEDGGEQTFDWQVYARIIEGIRAKIDVPVYPSIASPAISGPAEADAAIRFAHIEQLAKRGLIEFAVVDPGSVNMTMLNASAESAPAAVYQNPEAHVRHGLSLAAHYKFHPAYAIYEPGFTRAGAVLARAMGCPAPLYRFMFSDAYAFGFPPQPFGLAAHLALLRHVAPDAPWMIAGLGVDVTPLIGAAVAEGGHVRVGLEDAAFGMPATNVALVEAAVRRVRASGGEPASAMQMRRVLA